MPRKYSIKKRFPRKSYKKKYVSKSVKKYVSKKLDAQVEDKFWVVPASTALTPTNVAWDYYDLTSQIVQGVTGSTRIGRRIKVKSVYLNAVLSNTVDLSVTTRFVLFTTYDQSATPLSTVTLNELIQKNDQSLSQLGKKYVDRYFISNVSAAAVDDSRALKIYKKFRNLFVTYSTDVETNISRRLVIACICSGATATPVNFTAGFLKITYEDA